MPDLRIVVWNVEWQPPSSRRGRLIRDIIEKELPDIVFLTEAYSGTLPLNEAASAADYGYPLLEGRRKALMYSRESWVRVERYDETEMPPGRCVTGLTNVKEAKLWCCGVCVPWKMAHVATGGRNRRPWEEHRRFLDALRMLFKNAFPRMPVILAGDFNQTVPNLRAPADCHHALQEVSGHLRCVTSGLLPGASHHDVDHVFVSPHFEVSDLRALPNLASDGKPLSDHLGISLGLNFRV